MNENCRPDDLFGRGEALEDRTRIPSSPQPPTRWTLIWKYQNRQTDAAWAEAADELKRHYWNLVQFVIEKWGVLDPKSACADFFERVFFGKLLDAANPVRGRFRGLLRTSLGRFIVDNLRRQARDPLAQADPIDFERRAAELENDIDRGIARNVVERTLAALRLEYGESADQLEYLIGNKSGLPLADVAPRLGMTEGSLKVKRHRARSQFKELFLREVEEIAPRGEVREEAKYLFELYLSDGQGFNL